MNVDDDDVDSEVVAVVVDDVDIVVEGVNINVVVIDDDVVDDNVVDGVVHFVVDDDIVVDPVSDVESHLPSIHEHFKTF